MPIRASRPVKKFRGVIRNDIRRCGQYVTILLRRDDALADGKKFMSVEDHAAFEVVQNALTSYMAQTVDV